MALKLTKKPSANAAVKSLAQEQTMPSPTKLLTIKEAAAFAVDQAITVRRWLKAGFLRSYRAGRQIRI